MFFSVFNYYKKRDKKITLKKSVTKDTVKNMKNSDLSPMSLREYKKVVLCNT